MRNIASKQRDELVAAPSVPHPGFQCVCCVHLCAFGGDHGEMGLGHKRNNPPLPTPGYSISLSSAALAKS